MSPRLGLGMLAALVGHRIPKHLGPVAEALDKRRKAAALKRRLGWR